MYEHCMVQAVYFCYQINTSSIFGNFNSRLYSLFAALFFISQSAGTRHFLLCIPLTFNIIVNMLLLFLWSIIQVIDDEITFTLGEKI